MHCIYLIFILWALNDKNQKTMAETPKKTREAIWKILEIIEKTI